MVVDVFNVYESDEIGNYTCEHFGEDRESALNYLKMRNLMLTQQLKGWNKEVGINHSTWRKGKQCVDLFFDIQAIDTNDIDEFDM